MVKSCGCLKPETVHRQVARVRVNGPRQPVGIDFEYANRDGWRPAAIRHYGAVCVECGWDKAHCDVHHRIPQSKGGKNTIENAIVLCPNCHRLADLGALPLTQVKLRLVVDNQLSLALLDIEAA